MGRSIDEMMGIRSANSYERGAAARIARKAGVPKPRISATKFGREGLSLKNAYAVAEAANCKTPLSLYVLSQTRAIKSTRITAGGDSPGESAYASALRGVAAVLEELEKVTPEAMSAEADELAEALGELEKLISQVARDATGPGYDSGTKYPMGTMTTKGKVHIPAPEGGRTERDTQGRVVRSNGNSLERDPITGKRIRK